MDILEAIVTAQGGDAVRQLGTQVGLGETQTKAALSALVPALAAGMQRNIQGDGGLGSLITALSSGQHGRYLDDPATLGQQSTIVEGNGILGHLLGSKEVSREVASRAAAQTGVSADVLKRMLPLVATLLMGAFAKQSASSSLPGRSGGASSITSMLTPLLDKNRDGSIVDDVTSVIGRMMRS